MSRKRMKARDKVLSKMTKDGLVSRNAATGEEKRESGRESDFDLRGGAQETSPLKPQPQSGAQEISPNPQSRSTPPNTNHPSQRRRYEQPLQGGKDEAVTEAPQRDNSTPSQAQASYSQIGNTTVNPRQAFDSNTEREKEVPREAQRPKPSGAAHHRMPHHTPKGANVGRGYNSANANLPPPIQSPAEALPPMPHKDPINKPRLQFSEAEQPSGATPPSPHYRRRKRRRNRHHNNHPQQADSRPVAAIQTTEATDGGIESAETAYPEHLSRLQYEDTEETPAKTPRDKNKTARRFTEFAATHEPKPEQNVSACESQSVRDGGTEAQPHPPTAEKDSGADDADGSGGTAETTDNGRANAETAQPEHSSRLQYEKTEETPAKAPVDKNKTVRRFTEFAASHESGPEQDAAACESQSVRDSGEGAAENPATAKNDNDADSADDTDGTAETTNKPPDASDGGTKPENSKLRFTPEETTPAVKDSTDAKSSRKLGKAQHQYDHTNTKLAAARENLPTKRKLRKVRVVDEQTGKPKRKLYFETEVKTQAEHLKGALPLRPVKAGANAVIGNAHRMVYTVEHENVGVKAAHRAEMLLEGGVRSALRYRKTAPYRRVAKLEKELSKKSVKLSYQKTLADNPKLRSNMLSRMAQKRKIKKQYAAAKRNAKKAAKTAQKTGSVTTKAIKALAGVIRRHPGVAAIIALVLLLLFAFSSLVSLFAGAGSGGMSAVIAGSYLAEDADIDSATLAYSEWETDLLIQINSIETLYTGYDEYLYDIGTVGHDPYQLMAYLTAMYRNFTYDAISGDLLTLFNEQYTLTLTPSSETRYGDPFDTNEDGNYEPYTWYTLSVTLEARPFAEVIGEHMDETQQQGYEILMQTLGNRQCVANPFDFAWLPSVSSDYGYRVHPISGVKNNHKAVDIAVPVGTDILAAQDGTVSFAGYDDGYGYYVVIENSNGLVTKYAHCDSLSVSTGQTVSVGQVIALSGNTGSSTGPHLHFEVLKNGQYLNPLFYADTGMFG